MYRGSRLPSALMRTFFVLLLSLLLPSAAPVLFQTPHALGNYAPWTAPDRCTLATATVVGAGGGGGSLRDMNGGAGASLTFSVPVNGGASTLQAFVGGGGTAASAPRSYKCCGSGGSASALVLVSYGLLAVAGGGGGGCAGGSLSTTCTGGEGGKPIGTSACGGGEGATPFTGGSSGSCCFCGSRGTGPALSQGSTTGGNSWTIDIMNAPVMGWAAGGLGGCSTIALHRGGGGGGGYFGGGGGGYCDSGPYPGSGAPGGGGSSWINGVAQSIIYATGAAGGMEDSQGQDGSVSLLCSSCSAGSYLNSSGHSCPPCDPVRWGRSSLCASEASSFSIYSHNTRFPSHASRALLVLPLHLLARLVLL